MREIAAVVVTYRRPKLLAEVLDALASQTHPIAGVLVADNGGDPETAQAIEQARPRFPWLEVLRSRVNDGGAGGFSRGLARLFEAGGPGAAADAAWVMDDDCVPERDALERLLEPDLPPLALRAPAPCSEPGVLAFGHRAGRFDAARRRKEIRRVFWSPPAEVEQVVFAGFLGLLIPRAAYERLGPPIAGLFFQFDDVEYTYRAQAAGLGVYLVPRSVVRHPSQTLASIRLPGRHVRLPLFTPDKFYYYVRNSIYVHRRHAGLAFTLLRAIPHEGAGALLRTLYTGDIRLLLRAVEGALDGLRGALGRRVRGGHA